jgi:NNP family nitrate/nitrite transporter-like MFS transporter
MDASGKATRIELLNFRSVPMRVFHMTWLAFFLCFFAWFGIAPLMTYVEREMQLTDAQIGWCIIGSVSITVVARLVIGWLCDRVGPRLAYTWLLVLGSLPVMGIALARDFGTFLLFRVLIGAIGASFVITQYHTTRMFAANCVGTANATTAGWGNMGGGVTQLVMPLLVALFVGSLGWSEFWGWRAAMLVAGGLCLLTGLAYYRFTQDTPQGNFAQLRAEGCLPGSRAARGSFPAACRDVRVWALAAIYGACFGVELTINNIAARYFLKHFAAFQQLDTLHAVKLAGMVASLFGLMNLFARTLGGVFGDRFGVKWGLRGRVAWLFFTLFCEGLALMVFSQMGTLTLAIPALVVFSLFVQMSEGATFSVVPFVNRRALGSVAGIVGAGGNAGAVAAGFLFRGQLAWSDALLILGFAVTLCSFLALAVRFSPAAEAEARSETAAALGASAALAAEPSAA